MEGDSVNTSFHNSKTRRGRVGKQVAQTLQAREVNQGVVVDKEHNFYAKIIYYMMKDNMLIYQINLNRIIFMSNQL